MDPSELDPLYALPLGDFVSARNDLAKALKRDGRADDAKHVKALAKPSLVAWTINQIVRRYRADVERLFEALDDVRSAQLGDEDDPNRLSLPEAMARERAALVEIGEAAQTVLADGGHGGGKNTLDGVQRTIRAAAVDPARRDTLCLGQLFEEVVDDPFSALAAQLAGNVVPAARPPPPKASPEERPSPARPPAPPPPPIDLDAERRRREQLEREARAKAKKEKIAAKRREIEAFRLVEQKLSKDLDAAAHELSEAHRRLEAAQQNHDKARAKVAQALEQRAEAERELERLEADEPAS